MSLLRSESENYLACVTAVLPAFGRLPVLLVVQYRRECYDLAADLTLKLLVFLSLTGFITFTKCGVKKKGK